MTPGMERRKSNRIPVSSLITCYLKTGDEQYQGRLKDMSMTGLYLEIDSPPVSNEKCEIIIVINGQASRLRIEGLMGDIVRCDESGAAIRLDARMEWFPLVATYLSSRETG